MFFIKQKYPLFQKFWKLESNISGEILGTSQEMIKRENEISTIFSFEPDDRMDFSLLPGNWNGKEKVDRTIMRIKIFLTQLEKISWNKLTNTEIQTLSESLQTFFRDMSTNWLSEEWQDGWLHLWKAWAWISDENIKQWEVKVVVEASKMLGVEGKKVIEFLRSRTLQHHITREELERLNEERK